MIAVITGDLINSRKVPPEQWLPVLKDLLGQYGQKPNDWEIFRGDSFQLQVEPAKALKAAIHIKAGIKQIKNLDVRMGIGIGAASYDASLIRESNGEAFIRSGECFEALKKQRLGIHTGTEWDEVFNLMFSLALLNMDHWSVTVSAAIKTSLENLEKNQAEIAELLHKSQSSVSEALSRGGFEEVMRMILFFENKMEKL
jgi:hypothetical protein